MIFLYSISITTVLYIMLFVLAYNNARVKSYCTLNEDEDGIGETPFYKESANIGFDNDQLGGIASSGLFCIIYHFFIAVITIGSASFWLYFIPCLVIILLMVASIIYDYYEDKKEISNFNHTR